MQRKIKLEEISPYLPYRLKMREKDLTYVLAGLNQGYMLLYEDGDPSQEIFDAEIIEQSVKPVVRPLSDLIKEIEHDGEKFVPENFLTNMGYSILFEKNKFRIDFGPDIVAEFPELGKPYKIEWLPYKLYKKLFKWHFDVFNWLGDGLAVNINEL